MLSFIRSLEELNVQDLLSCNWGICAHFSTKSPEMGPMLFTSEAGRLEVNHGV